MFQTGSQLKMKEKTKQCWSQENKKEQIFGGIGSQTCRDVYWFSLTQNIKTLNRNISCVPCTYICMCQVLRFDVVCFQMSVVLLCLAVMYLWSFLPVCRLSGFMLPSPIVSSGSILALWFTTDFAVSAQGFKAVYEGKQMWDVWKLDRMQRQFIRFELYMT